jgi:hypothetical protein
MVIPTAAQLADPTSSTYGSHSVGGDDATGGIFFLGWNTAHGDLRVSHFIGMHALQVLPILAITLPRALGEADRLRIVLVAGATYAAGTALALWQALRGQSVIHPDAITITVVGVTAVLAAMSLTIIAAQRRHQHR